MEISSWQQELREITRDPSDLLKKLGLSENSVTHAEESVKSFPLRVPENYISRMQARNVNDPLLLQVLPIIQEDYEEPGFFEDPVGDLDTQTVPGVLHKYHGRVLMLVTGACAIHCRYCFRQHFPYNDANSAKENWQPALDYIKKDISISEVILSGGDPLILSDNKLRELTSKLAQIQHLKRIRIHTRMPIVLPSRITESIINALLATRLMLVMVIHSNHHHEVSREVGSALEKLRNAGISLLNQCVLLKNINDNADTLISLNEALFKHGVLPYYLHLMDRVKGAAHFVVPDKIALEIMRELRTKLPGYLVPRLVREVAGEPYKISLL